MARRSLGALACVAAFVVAAPAVARNTIKIGVPMPLSGPAALYGEPAAKGMRMFVEEINATGGVLGKKLELLVRDSKASADEAVRVSREMILKEEVQFLVGTLTSAEGPAVSTIAKENKIVLIAPIPKTDQLTAEKNLHPYVFRTAANTTKNVLADPGLPDSCMTVGSSAVKRTGNDRLIMTINFARKLSL